MSSFLSASSFTPRWRGALTALAAASLVAFMACDDDSLTGPEPVASVEMSTDSARVLKGNQEQLQAAPVAADGDTLSGREVAWESSDESVATVDTAGQVSAVGAGTATIRATSGDATGEAQVDVPQPDGSVDSGGGTVTEQGDPSTPEDVTLVIPQDALSDPTDITIVAADPADLPTGADADGFVGGSAYEFAPDGTQFSPDATLTIRYDAGEIPADAAAFLLELNRLENGAWQPVAGSQVDEQNTTVTAPISGFSVYGIVAADNQAPTAQISAPADGATFEQGDAVTFQGSGTDPEEGAIPGDALAWSSDLDGSLGTGSELTVSDLSAGSHQVTLTATDGLGATGTASIGITVQQKPAGVAINEVENRDSEGTRHGGDYVELLVTSAGSLDGFTLEMVAIDGQTYGQTSLSGTVQAGDLLLVGGSAFGTADYSFVGIQDGPGAVRIVDSGGATLDAVKWGEADLGLSFQAQALDQLPLAAVIQREPSAQTEASSDEPMRLGHTRPLEIQDEQDATPAERNRQVGIFDVAMNLRFVNPGNATDLTELVLRRGEYFTAGAILEVLSDSPNSAGGDIHEAFENPTGVIATFDDMVGPFNLAIGEATTGLVAIVCLVEDGQARAVKTATAIEGLRTQSDVIDKITVFCKPTGQRDQPSDSPPLPPPPEGPTSGAAELGVTIADEVGDEIPGLQAATGDSVFFQIRLDNTGISWPLVFLQGESVTLDPDGLWVIQQHEFTAHTALSPGESRTVAPDAIDVTLMCPGPGTFHPTVTVDAAADPGSVLKTSDMDGVPVECLQPEKVVSFTRTDASSGVILSVAPSDPGNTTALKFAEGEFSNGMRIAYDPDPFAVIHREITDFGPPIQYDIAGQILTMEDDGSNQQQITTTKAFYRRGSANEAGTKLVFESDRDDPKGDAARDSVNDVFVMNVDGTGLVKVITEAGYPSFTPAGRIVHATDADVDGLFEVRVAESDGSSPSLLIDDDDVENYAWWQPVVSPDGTKIAVTRVDFDTFQRSILVGDYDGTSVANLQVVAAPVDSFDPGAWDPAWSPDSQQIAFTSTRSGDSEVWVMNADGSGKTNLSQSSATQDFHPFWSVP